MEVLIGITCRNVEHTIGPVLKSILRLDYPRENMRILVVDSESTDNTIHIIRDVLSRSNVKHELIVKRCTIPQGRNIILDYLCKNNLDAVLFIDADVLINDVDLLNKLEDILSNIGRYNVVFFKVRNTQFNNVVELNNFADTVLLSNKRIPITEIRCVDWCPLGLTAVPLEIAGKVKFNEKLTFAEDRGFGYDVWINGYKVLEVIGSEPFGFDLNIKRKTSIYSMMSLRDYLHGAREKARVLAYMHSRAGMKWIYRSSDGRKTAYHTVTLLTGGLAILLALLGLTGASAILATAYTTLSLLYIAKQLGEQEAPKRALKNLVKQQIFCPLMTLLVSLYVIKYRNVFREIHKRISECNYNIRYIKLTTIRNHARE